MDVYSRYLLWLRVGMSNHDPFTILMYYLDAIEEVANENDTGECMPFYRLIDSNRL